MFFCSEFVAILLSDSRFYGFKKEINLVTPQDLEILAIFKCVYTGSLYNYLAFNPNKLVNQI